jgi:hypothetical protein
MLQGKYPFQFDSYWYNSNGQSNLDYPGCEPRAPEISPSVTFVNPARVRLAPTAHDKIIFLGKFAESRKYRARFSQRDMKPPFMTEVNSVEVDCQVLDPDQSNLQAIGLVGWSSELRCEIPGEWSHGYQAAVVSIMEQTDNNEFRFVWSRSCFRSECGYQEFPNAGVRKFFEGRWIVKTGCCNVLAGSPCEGRLQASNAVSGIPTRVRLLTESTVLELEEAAETLALRYPVPYKKNPAVSLLQSDLLLRSGIFESRTHPFTSVSQLAILGASSISALESAGTLYLLVANFWDGSSLHVQSTVLRVDNLDQGHMTLVQGFETKGARKFHSFQMQGQTYVALANFAENSAIFKWRPGMPISNSTIVDPGFGYVDGRIVLRCLRPAQYCSGNGAFSAEFRVDGPAHGGPNGTVGRIVDVFHHIENMGDDYLADHDVVLTYLHDNKTMDQTISAITFVEPLQLQCSRLVDGLSLRVGFQLSTGCSNGTKWTYINPDLSDGGFQARLSKVDGAIIGIKVDPPGLFEGNLDAPLVDLLEPNSDCYCSDNQGNRQTWSSCLTAQSDLSYPKFKVSGDADGGGSGFRATFELASSGAVHGLQIRNHGESYLRTPSLLVEVEMGLNTPLKNSARSSGGCSCLSKTTGSLLPWEKCIHIARAHGSYTCAGGDHHGKPCEGRNDVSSCRGHQSGTCRAGKRARVYAHTHSSPERARSIKYVEQDPDWIDAPGRSSTVPLDLNARVDLPLQGGTDIVSFTKDSTTYLAMSVYLDATTNSRSTSSVVFKLSAADSSLRAEQYQKLDTQGAQAVNTWTMLWCEPNCEQGPGRYPMCSVSCTNTTFVMFACERRSPLYRWDDSLKQLVHVQDVPTENATSIEAFNHGNISYVIVSQVGPVSQMLRWNGTMLLGSVDESTKMRDTAGGQNIETGSAQAALHFSTAGEHDLLVFGNHLDGVTPALLYRARVEHVRNIGSPVRVLAYYNSNTGKSFVYVASSKDSVIRVFERAAGDLYYNPKLSDGITDVSLEGIADIAIFGDQLYSASSMRDGGTINVFTIHGNGSMTEHADLRVSAKDTHYGLRGVRTLWVGSEYIFTASFVDQSLTAFLRNASTGRMQYLDHVQNGERIVSSFEQYSKQIPFNQSTNFFLEGKLPERVGREGTGDDVSCVSYGLVHEKHLFAVAYVPKPLNCNESRCTESSLVEVYIYEYHSDHFVEVQGINGPTNVTGFEFFRSMEWDGKWADFLVIVSAVGKSSLYKYDPGEAGFIFFETLSFRLPDSSYLPPDCATLGLCNPSVDLIIPGREYVRGTQEVREQIILPAWENSENRTISARRAKSFVMKEITYLAVAHWWPFSNGHGWFSIVYRWQRHGDTVLANGKSSQGSGFEIFQVIPMTGPWM